MNGSDSRNPVGDSVDSSLDEPLVRGGTIDFSVDDGFATAAKAGGGRRIDGGTLVFAGVVVASIAGLWSMRFLGTISGDAIALPVEVLAEVADFNQSAGGDDGLDGMGDLAILDDLDTRRFDPLRVPLQDLGRSSPFVYDGEIPTTVVEATSMEPVQSRQERLRRDFESVIAAIGHRMQVTAILAPDTPKAQTVLNGHRLMVGDVFDVPHEGAEYEFEVTRIGADGVWFRSVLAEPAHEITIEVPVHRDF